MTYAVGGLISATDYNSLINGTNQLNTVWSTGAGDSGYGQPAIAAVAAGSVVTATQWATLISRLNSARTHQSGAGAGITAPVAGATIAYLATLQTQVDSAYTNRNLFASQGTTLTGTNGTRTVTATATAAFSGVHDANVTFASADAARYFFNAGGQLNFVVTATDAAGTARSISVRDSINQLGGVSAFRQTTNGGRTGAGGTLAVNNTGVGYRNNLLNTESILVQINDDAPYTGYTAKISTFRSSNDLTNGAVGTDVVFRVTAAALADDSAGGAINVTITSRVDIVYPESTNLTNVWGTPVVTFDQVV